MDCRKFYLQIHPDISAQCRWCFLIEKKTGHAVRTRRESMCIVCYKESDRHSICDDCVKKINVVRKSMEYTYYISWLGKYMREPVFESGKQRIFKNKISSERIK